MNWNSNKARVPKDAELINMPKKYKKNNFIEESLLAIGGGGINILKGCSEKGRLGGTTQDKLHYLANYTEVEGEKTSIKLSSRAYAKMLFPGPRIKVGSPTEMLGTMQINVDANPGEFLREAGVNTKGEGLHILHDLFSDLYYEKATLKNDYKTKEKLEMIEKWNVASRPKLTSYKRAADKAENGMPVGRVISMSSAFEQGIGYPIWKPLSDRIGALNSIGPHYICIGIHKYGKAWGELGKRLSKKDSIYCGDWSRYDSTVRADLIKFSLDVIESSIDLLDTQTSDYWTYIKPYLTKNLIEKQYLIGDVEVDVFNGIPSGSLWTSLLDSVINFIAINESLMHMDIDTEEIYVYGDDHIVGFDDPDGSKRKHFKRRFGKITRSKFGMLASQDDCYITTGREMRVGYQRPVFKSGLYLSKGTRNLKPKRFEYSSKPFETYDHRLGTTHRWNYDFRRRPKFLSFYWDMNFKPIRSLGETMERLINPENSVSDPIANEMLILSHLIDNFYNDHVMNWGYHLLYDNDYLKKLFDWKRMFLPKSKSLWNDNPYKLWYMSTPETRNERGWYRRIKDVVGFEHEPSMHFFSKWYDTVIKEIINIMAKAQEESTWYDLKGTLLKYLLREQSESTRKIAGIQVKRRTSILDALRGKVEKTVSTDLMIRKTVNLKRILDGGGIEYSWNGIMNFMSDERWHIKWRELCNEFSTEPRKDNREGKVIDKKKIKRELITVSQYRESNYA